MTYRAVRLLGEVDHIACEDTRVTRRLLDHFEIQSAGRLLRHDQVNENASTEGILALLAQPSSVALLTDAGTPGVSDPGHRLVAAAVDAGFPVVPLPGASAVLAALSASGLPASRFSFHGFLPKRASDRVTLFPTLPPGTHVFFGPARDLGRTLADLAASLPDVPTVVARELTKVHETWYRGTATALAEKFEDEKPKGEAVILIHREQATGEHSDRDLVQALMPLLEGGVRKKEAAKEVAEKFGVSKRRCYQLAVKIGQ